MYTQAAQAAQASRAARGHAPPSPREPSRPPSPRGGQQPRSTAAGAASFERREGGANRRLHASHSTDDAKPSSAIGRSSRGRQQSPSVVRCRARCDRQQGPERGSSPGSEAEASKRAAPRDDRQQAPRAARRPRFNRTPHARTTRPSPAGAEGAVPHRAATRDASLRLCRAFAGRREERGGGVASACRRSDVLLAYRSAVLMRRLLRFLCPPFGGVSLLLRPPALPADTGVS